MHHRGIEFEVVEVSRFKWRWTIYAKKSLELGKTTREVPATSRSQVVAKCRLEIDRKLERKRNAQGANPTGGNDCAGGCKPVNAKAERVVVERRDRRG
jgi:hypothetical protein